MRGINYYPGLRHLEGAVDDSETFLTWTRDIGCVPKEQITPVRSPQDPPTTLTGAEPKTEAINEAFQELIRKAAKDNLHRLGRRLYIFCAGHGIVAGKDGSPDFREAALLAADAEPLFLGKHVGLRSWAEWFRTRAIFDEILMVADCCREMEDLVAPKSAYNTGLEASAQG